MFARPGFHVFSKFVKLPPVDTSKVTQIIRYEAQQNVPFPLDEVVWDYQILGTSATSELEVLLVAVKSEIVEGLFRVRGRRRVAPEAGGCLAGGAMQRLPLQLRRSGGLHHAAGHRRQDQQPALFREGQGLFPQHQHRRQFHHAGFRQRGQDEVSGGRGDKD